VTSEEREKLTRELNLLMQRRYNVLRNLKEVTDQLADAYSRQDQVSVELILDMRLDVIAKVQENWDMILEIGETGEEEASLVRRLILQDPEKAVPQSEEEQELLQTRTTCRRLLKDLREEDRLISIRAGHEKSIYWNSGKAGTKV
jgi:hypothetical protein